MFIYKPAPRSDATMSLYSRTLMWDVSELTRHRARRRAKPSGHTHISATRGHETRQARRHEPWDEMMRTRWRIHGHMEKSSTLAQTSFTAGPGALWSGPKPHTREHAKKLRTRRTRPSSVRKRGTGEEAHGAHACAPTMRCQCGVITPSMMFRESPLRALIQPIGGGRTSGRLGWGQTVTRSAVRAGVRASPHRGGCVWTGSVTGSVMGSVGDQSLDGCSWRAAWRARRARRLASGGRRERAGRRRSGCRPDPGS